MIRELINEVKIEKRGNPKLTNLNDIIEAVWDEQEFAFVYFDKENDAYLKYANGMSDKATFVEMKKAPKNIVAVVGIDGISENVYFDTRDENKDLEFYLEIPEFPLYPLV